MALQGARSLRVAAEMVMHFVAKPRQAASLPSASRLVHDHFGIATRGWTSC